LWCFYEEKEDVIRQSYSELLNSFKSSIGQRLLLYRGVDCNLLFPDFLRKITAQYDTGEASNEIAESSNLKPIESSGSKALDESSFLCDAPPTNLHWVGRDEEIRLLTYDRFKTCFITGIGGQGKSGLASHFIHQVVSSSDYELWDWRDCKEEDNKLHTIITSQIERLSNGRFHANKLLHTGINDLISLLFQSIGKRKIAFVYDNVDRYIDLEKFQPFGVLHQLFVNANTIDHKAVFIFTCRPKISFVGSNFREIALAPLPIDKTIELFRKYQTPISDENLVLIAKEAHILTNGHALWLSLIAAQAMRGLEIVQLFLKNYKNTKASKVSDELRVAEYILDVVWKTLNVKQQTLLRGMAELVTALNKEELDTIFSAELSSFNQFNKALNALRGLNLLVVKSSLAKDDTYELHPLVKEYILSRYRNTERSKYITMLVSFYDRVILLIKPSLDENSPLSYFEKYTQKAELHINNGDFKEALISLNEINHGIHKAGFNEEYIRVCSLLYSSINWFQAVTEEYTYFDTLLSIFLHDLTERGNNQEVEENLSKYEQVIPAKGKAYLRFCSDKSYYYWYKGQHEVAVDWAERGIDLENNTGLTSDSELSHRLALALRDLKTESNIERALKIFLQGEKLEDVLSDNKQFESFGSAYFGNIGRCLWFQNKSQEALVCYIKSYKILKSERNVDTILNLGYACLWISEVMVSVNDLKSALLFLKYCLLNWEKVAPGKEMEIRREYYDLLNSKDSISILHNLTDWDIEQGCTEYAKKFQAFATT
jgi:tetratricopeptide (TPR) repeat protein